MIRELEKSLAVLEGVEAVASIADLMVRRGLLPMSILPQHGATVEDRKEARVTIEAHPFGSEQLIDPDFRFTVLFVRLYSGELTVEAMNPMIEGMERAIEAASVPAGTEIILTGSLLLGGKRSELSGNSLGGGPEPDGGARESGGTRWGRLGPVPGHRSARITQAPETSARHSADMPRGLPAEG